MRITRREFIKLLGISMAWVAITQCARLTGEGDTPRDRLRGLWIQLDALASKTKKDYEAGQKMRDQLGVDHLAALNDLVEAGELKKPVADQIQAAYEGALYHVWRSNAPITCYEPMQWPEYTPASSDQLAKKAEILAEMAKKGKIDQATVAQAQAAIERDIVFLAFSDEDTQAFYERLRQGAGETDYPDFEGVDLEITPEAAEAAQYLVKLLLEK
jgi:hypothetical protein